MEQGLTSSSSLMNQKVKIIETALDPISGWARESEFLVFNLNVVYISFLGLVGCGCYCSRSGFVHSSLFVRQFFCRFENRGNWSPVPPGSLDLIYFLLFF
jgi:hypothetical protein